ncbi:hypothetical protein [Paenibacillus sp. DMB20]|uniref:hypothetical protein n=1 Tax=Paenibacillus sp. DMB20 TaxID=1642570 RepID=UPI0006277B88|nr:hypothetical protein [Paenibacillus sp. DMB20]KKO54004.1 hypothetical protein XI25_07645 [Paenibacillus sp. DMB20]
MCNKVEFSRKTEFWAKTRTTDGKEIATSSTCMQNKYIKVEVNPNGTISILNKENGNCYNQLNYFESFLMENGNLQATIGVSLAAQTVGIRYADDLKLLRMGKRIGA